MITFSPQDKKKLLKIVTVQNKQGTHEQPSQNKKTVVDHPGDHTQY